MGMHLLHPEELSLALPLLRIQDPKEEKWVYVTIPYSLEDVGKPKDWQNFFDLAKKEKVVPIVRLVTRAHNGVWLKPSYFDVVTQLNSLNKLDWPTQEKHIIVFNEVNHAKEWENEIDPADYAKIFRFSSQWAKALDQNFVILPAAMDLAAPNGKVTLEAFNYLEQMLEFDPEIFRYADAWNSHSYPNPAFSAPPTNRGKNSLRGFEYELAFLAKHGYEAMPVFITETGWEYNKTTARKLDQYYQYALENIWLKDERIVAVTPFVFRGAPGPFAGFSFLGADGKPTVHHQALSRVLGAMSEKY